jgi:hypothetical protein
MDATLFHRWRAELATARERVAVQKVNEARRDSGSFLMAFQNLNWGNVHASAYRRADAMLRRAEATPRPHGALRYRCPVTGSFVLVTDEASLDQLAQPPARLRCVDCHELHLLEIGCAAVDSSPHA